MRDDRERLLDILEAIERLEKYASRGRAAFEQDELVQTWMIHNLLIIGEATRALSSRLKDQYSDIPWFQIIGLRNTITHQYFDVDADIIWGIIENDIPEFKGQVEAVLYRKDLL